MDDALVLVIAIGLTWFVVSQLFSKAGGTAASFDSPEDSLLEQINAQGISAEAYNPMETLPSYSPNDPNAPWNQGGS